MTTMNLAPLAYQNTDCNATFTSTTWTAVLSPVGTTPLRKILFAGNCDQPLEWGLTSGAGDTACGYIPLIGGAFFIAWDIDGLLLAATLYLRKKKNGTTPTASTYLSVTGLY